MTFSSLKKKLIVLSYKIITCQFVLAFNTWFEKVFIDIKLSKAILPVI